MTYRYAMTYSVQIGPRLFRKRRDYAEVVEYPTRSAVRASPHVTEALMPSPKRRWTELDDLDMFPVKRRQEKPKPDHVWVAQYRVTLTNSNCYLFWVDSDGDWWESWNDEPEHKWASSARDFEESCDYGSRVDILT